VLYVVDRAAPNRRTMDDIRLRDGLLIGVAQAVALQPGVSRSGVTITAARGLGLKREDAARFSFLLALPIIGGAGAFEGAKLLTGAEHIPPGFGAPFVWGMASSAVSGFLVIWFLLAYLRRRDFAPFVLYRLAAAGVVFGVIASGLRPGTL
jgi:undecaprenyl-diphosphatase